MPALSASASRLMRKFVYRYGRLSRMRDELDDCIGCGCLSTTDCPLRNGGDVLGQDGVGAVILGRPRTE